MTKSEILTRANQGYYGPAEGMTDPQKDLLQGDLEAAFGTLRLPALLRWKMFTMTLSTSHTWEGRLDAYQWASSTVFTLEI
jgi:hypothetical protein